MLNPSPCAYVTLVTNSDYVLGAFTLARSLRAVGSAYPLVVLANSDVKDLERLSALGCLVQMIEPLTLSAEFCQRHGALSLHAAAPFTRGIKPAFHSPLDNFHKLQIWRLTQYKKVVYLDADTLVLANIDRLFRYPAFSAAPNVYQELSDFGRMNAGVFVAQPAEKTFESMMMQLDVPGVFWRRTDQTFLEQYWPDWNGLPYGYNALQYLYFNQPRLWLWQNIKVIHYQYEKPWMENHPKQMLLAPLINLWWRVMETGSIPPLPRVDGLQ